MAMGTELEEGIALMFGLWILYAAIIGRICFAIKPPVWKLALFAVCIYAGQPLLDHFGYAGPDFFVVFLVILLLCCANASARWPLFFGLASGLAQTGGVLQRESGVSPPRGAGFYYPVGFGCR